MATASEPNWAAIWCPVLPSLDARFNWASVYTLKRYRLHHRRCLIQIVKIRTKVKVIPDTEAVSDGTEKKISLRMQTIKNACLPYRTLTRAWILQLALSNTKIPGADPNNGPLIGA